MEWRSLKASPNKTFQKQKEGIDNVMILKVYNLSLYLYLSSPLPILNVYHQNVSSSFPVHSPIVSSSYISSSSHVKPSCSRFVSSRGVLHVYLHLVSSPCIFILYPHF